MLNSTAIIAAAVVLALIIIAVAAFSMLRRRRRLREEQEWADARTMGYHPFESDAAPESEIYDEQPAIVAPDASAFAWGNEHEVREGERAAIEEAEDRTPA